MRGVCGSRGVGAALSALALSLAAGAAAGDPPPPDRAQRRQAVIDGLRACVAGEDATGSLPACRRAQLRVHQAQAAVARDPELQGDEPLGAWLVQLSDGLASRELDLLLQRYVREGLAPPEKARMDVLCRARDERDARRPATALGRPLYVAGELAGYDRDGDGRADLDRDGKPLPEGLRQLEGQNADLVRLFVWWAEAGPSDVAPVESSAPASGSLVGALGR